MEDIYCYSYVEDMPSAEVAKKLVAHRNAQKTHKIWFFEGFPKLTGGNNALKAQCPSFLNMARGGLYTFTITDLDERKCAGDLISDWFGFQEAQPIALPREVVFRIAVREVESWIIADVNAWAEYIGIPAGNFSKTPDELPHPKQHLLNVLRQKGRKKMHTEMLPRGTGSIGPGYNEVLCGFVSKKWSPGRASRNSPSLKRAIEALQRL